MNCTEICDNCIDGSNADWFSILIGLGVFGFAIIIAWWLGLFKHQPPIGGKDD